MPSYIMLSLITSHDHSPPAAPHSFLNYVAKSFEQLSCIELGSSFPIRRGTNLVYVSPTSESSGKEHSHVSAFELWVIFVG